MILYCRNCMTEATFVESNGNTVPFFEEGYYECRGCGNGGRVTDNTPEGNRMNGYIEE